MTLMEKQFQIGDDGVVFGWDQPVDIARTGFQPGAAELRTNDLSIPGRDGVRPGRAYKGAANWTFEMFTNLETEADAWAAVEELQAAWDADELRENAGTVTFLRYKLAGELRRVYGVPRRFSPVVGENSPDGLINIIADFLAVDHLVYEDELQSHTVGIAPPPDSSEGFKFPLVFPYSTQPSTSTRQSQILVGGTRPTPAMVTFTAGAGTLTEASVQVAGWTVKLADVVQPGDPVTADGRPWETSVLRSTGGGVRVVPRVTQVAKMWLPPGQHEVIFTGDDPTSTASVTVSWRNARRATR